MPALLTRTVAGPSRLAISFWAATTDAPSVRSARTAIAVPPPCSTSRDHVGGLGAIQHRDRGALACQPQRVGPADPARPAGDDGDPAVVAAGHDATSWGRRRSAPMRSNSGAEVDVDPQRGDPAVRGAVEERHARQRDLGAALGRVVQERLEHGGACRR